jgi:dTMP kinase
VGKGIFITFEGPDGSGKSTQVKLLAEYCQNHGFDVLVTREPGGTSISESIRTIILDPKNTEMNIAAEALLYAASRAQLVSQVIRPSLEKGKIVICDRFMDSSIAYQGYARGLGDSVRVINEFAIQQLQPDLTFFLDLPPEAGLRRAALNGFPDRLEQESLDFHNAVYRGYQELAKLYKDRYVRIDASRSASAVHEDIAEVFARYVSENH